MATFSMRLPGVNRANTEDAAFKERLRLTKAILIYLSMLFIAITLIGEPTSCLVDGANHEHDINTFLRNIGNVTNVFEFSQMYQECHCDPMVAICPRVLIFKYNKFDQFGTIQICNALCMLELKTLNKKIFLFLWYWFITCAIVCGMATAYSIAIVTMPSYRKRMLCRFKWDTPQSVSALSGIRWVRHSQLQHNLGQNMNMLHSTETLEDLNSCLHLGNNLPTAPSTQELSPMYPSDQLGRHRNSGLDMMNDLD